MPPARRAVGYGCGSHADVLRCGCVRESSMLRCQLQCAPGIDCLTEALLLLLQNFYQDIHDVAHQEGTQTKVVHDRAEVFDIKAEALFRYLQVRAPCC